MSRKTVIISVIVSLMAVLIIAFLTVRFSGNEPEIISKEYALERGSDFLMSYYQLHESAEFDAVMDGDAWRVFSTPGSDETGKTLDEYYIPCYVFINSTTGEYLTFASESVE